VVVAFGATEQHGHHMPLATDALLGDHLARRLADRLDAFVAPTVRVGCSSHHLAFPGTLSLADQTFHAVVADLVSSLVQAGLGRIVLVPSHGGNFAPLAAAVAKLPDSERQSVVAITDLSVLLRVAQLGEQEFQVPMSEGGLHAGEWETSMLLAIQPDLVQMERAEPGFVGDPQEAVATLFEGGVDALSKTGAIGDPTRASAEHGRRYWEVVVDLAVELVEAESS
jgi:creatinine amidohydrolase/Fe(II)-dependent formamide hydrolase-like protein